MVVGDNGSFPPITELSTAPQASEPLTAWGYGEGIPSMRSFAMRVADGGPTLKQNVPGSVANTLTRTGSPSLDLRVIPIDASMAAGLSGAPLLDAAGRVRAIADGGVAHGITHVSWAIPVQYLSDLVSSNEPTNALIATNANLSALEETRAEVFSADFVRPDAETISCGSARLRRVRARAFAEVSAGTDSPMGLTQLVNVFGGAVPPFNLDVYEDVESGATVAVPAGARLSSQDGVCRTSLLGGQIEMRIQVTRFPPAENVLVASKFEFFAATPPAQAWAPDPAWTYYAPFFRPDGLVVVRKAFGRVYPLNALGAYHEYMFETLAVRNGTFVGVAAIRHNDYALAMCMRGLPGATCPPPQYLPTWAQVALSVHLATFAIAASNPNLAAWQQGPGGF
jgi:hypothetical protein